MAKPILDDELWALIEPVLPPPKPRRSRFPGRKPVGQRESLTGIVFVLISGISWEMLPKELGCGSGMTCWRRLRDWTEAGVWPEVHRILLSRLLNDMHELVTLIEGEGAKVGDTRSIEEWLSDEYPDVALEVHQGGQPLYPYLLGIE